MQSEDILVIGAGPAGLATSARIAAAWYRHYDRLHLHTTKTLSGLPMSPWPKAAPRYPARQEVVEYLQAYADEHHIAPRLGVNVHAVQRTHDRFAVDTSAGVMTPRIVVMATGYNAVQNLPSIPGLESFNGSAVHAAFYTNTAPY